MAREHRSLYLIDGELLWTLPYPPFAVEWQGENDGLGWHKEEADCSYPPGKGRVIDEFRNSADVIEFPLTDEQKIDAHVAECDVCRAVRRLGLWDATYDKIALAFRHDPVTAEQAREKAPLLSAKLGL